MKRKKVCPVCLDFEAKGQWCVPCQRSYERYKTRYPRDNDFFCIDWTVRRLKRTMDREIARAKEETAAFEKMSRRFMERLEAAEKKR
jgi:hypothetical protein